ncbi:bacteriocin maturation protein [Cohnella soli]|uniref:Bacteriocin maturation protein n=1 Tax=Cohnella soli TaxID=425005 RepID=A0ABW0HQ65_9BACL
MVKLPDNVVERYDVQIKFLDHLGTSGATAFRSYRESKTLAVGAGSFLVSLVAALFESGLLNVHAIVTDAGPTDRRLFISLAEKARKMEPRAELTLDEATVMDWREKIRPFDWILYADKRMKLNEVRTIHTACREEKKNLLIATCVGHMGFAGPLVTLDSDGCWESAWRRLHHSAVHSDPMIPIISSAAEPMLANIIVFDMFRTITQVTKPELENKFLLLDLHTLEGNYHSFLPHPLVTQKGMTTEQVQNLDELLVCGKSNDGDPTPTDFLSIVHQLTSPQSGILHHWDEGDLNQLPLSQCRVQAVDPLSEGPAELLPVMICAGLTHMEARKEAGLAGIEAYLTRMANFSDFQSHHAMPSEYIEISAGETVEEAVYRGLQKCLTQQLRRQIVDRQTNVRGIQLHDVQDVHCRYYLQALTTMQGAPSIGLGDHVLGFPVVWVGSGDHWYGSVGLNRTLALRMALQQALLKAQNRAEIITLQGVEIPNLVPEEAITTPLEIEAVTDYAELIHEALSDLKRNRTRLLVYKIMVEPFLNEHLGGLFGVMLEKEEDQGE